MTDTKWVRWAAVAGVVFFVLILVSGPVLLGSGPTLTDSASTVFSYFVNHQSSLKASAALWGLAMSAALVWAAALFSALRKAEGGRAGLAVAALGGVILATAMQVVALAAQATATLRTHELGASGVGVLFTFETLANGGILFGLLVAVGAAGVGFPQDRALRPVVRGCQRSASGGVGRRGLLDRLRQAREPAVDHAPTRRLVDPRR